MSYRINYELIVDETTAHFIADFKINVAQVCTEAIIAEVARQSDIRKITQVKPIEQEIEDLKRALQFMRVQRDTATAELKKKDSQGIFSFIRR